MRHLLYAAAFLSTVLVNALLLAQQAAEAPVVPPREGKSETIKLFNGKTSTAGRGTRSIGRSRTA